MSTIDQDADECIHGIYPASSCSICNGNQHERVLLAQDWRTFPAKYDGNCAGCDLPISVGQWIVWRPDSPTYHDGCEP